MMHARHRTSADVCRPAARSGLPASSDRTMIDLSHYLRKLDQSSVTWARPGHRRGSATPEPDRRSRESRWPCLAGQQDQGADAVLVRARLGNYQRALTSARKTLQRSNPISGSRPFGASLFTTTNNSDGGADRGSSAEQGGDL
jgi:hypothetical protein